MPVLSEQIVVAEPMVSHESRCFTWLLSLVMRRIDTANDNVTANGKPSGIATTKIVMPVTKKLRSSERSEPVSQARLQVLDLASKLNIRNHR